MTDWLLVETFGGHEPTVLAVGDRPRTMMPLNRLLGNGRNLTDVRRLIAQVAESGAAVDKTTRDGTRRMIGHPLPTYGGRVHGLFIWVGKLDEHPPARDRAGAWHVNLAQYISSRSDDLLDLFEAQPGNRLHEHSLAELFAGRLGNGEYGRLQTNNDEAAAMAKLVDSQQGDVHMATWTATRDDGERRAVNFAFRTVAEPNDQGEVELIARGITHDIGPADAVPAAPPPQQFLIVKRSVPASVLHATRKPGQWRAIVNPRTLDLVRWYHDPMPEVAWEMGSPHRPGIHRADLRTAVAMAEEMTRSGRVTGRLRFRATDGTWMPLEVDARLMVLKSTVAALVTLSRPRDSA